MIFERFLNPERVSPPDIDIDFCQARRGEVIDYVRGKYGERAVSHIITFQTLGAKSVVRDVARVMGLSYGDGDRIAKMIPPDLGMTLAKAEEMNPELAAAIDTESAARQLWEPRPVPRRAHQRPRRPRGRGRHRRTAILTSTCL